MIEERKTIAVIGGGIGGLTAAYLLSPHHDVTLFEKSDRLGGNAYTYVTKSGEYVDIAVAAFGKAGYDHFYGLLANLGIETRMAGNSYMSLHNMISGEGLYITPTLRGSIAQGMDLFKTSTLKSVAGLFLGLRRAQKLLDDGQLSGKSMAECLTIVPHLNGDAQRILICALCLLSSMSAPEIMASPAEFFLRKLRTHHDVISPKAAYSVRCAKDGTQAYVNALADRFRDRIILNSEIETISRKKSGVTLHLKGQPSQTFNAVVLATNADQALSLLKEPSSEEQRLLGVWKYKDGRIVVHRDHSAFPPRDLIQAYTFLYTERNGVFETSVNGALWHEPNAPADSEYISTQHPNFPIREDLIELDTVLRTPIFDFDSYPIVSEMPSLNGTLNTYYCGSHFGFGLHDDAVKSAIAVVKHFGVHFEPKDELKALAALKTLIS